MCSDGSGTIQNEEYDRRLPPVDASVHSDVDAQAVDCAVVTLDRIANVTSWNAEAELLFGYPASAAVAKPFYHFLELESLTPGNVEWELQTAYYRGKSICVRQYTHQDGTQFEATAEIVPLWEGEFLGYKLTFSGARRAPNCHNE